MLTSWRLQCDAAWRQLITARFSSNDCDVSKWLKMATLMAQIGQPQGSAQSQPIATAGVSNQIVEHLRNQVNPSMPTGCRCHLPVDITFVFNTSDISYLEGDVHVPRP